MIALHENEQKIHDTHRFGTSRRLDRYAFGFAGLALHAQAFGVHRVYHRFGHVDQRDPVSGNGQAPTDDASHRTCPNNGNFHEIEDVENFGAERSS
jgi:hypothetical protein